MEKNDNEILLGKTRFDEAIDMAEKRGFRLAGSNDAFELWVLLHFEDVDIAIAGNKNKATYYDRLIEIFKSLPDPNEDLLKTLQHATFNYKQDLKHENNFRNIVSVS